MNELIVPPTPQWYKSAILACAPDNTLVYGGITDLVIVKKSSSEKSPEIQVIPAIHKKCIIASISLNKNWGDPHKYAVVLTSDDVLTVWDLSTYEQKFVNKEHSKHHKDPVIGAVFAGDDRIVSVSNKGFIIVWNMHMNESRVLKDIFHGKVVVTCLSSCPHANWLVAFGLQNGCVIVADMRKEGTFLYKLRGHHQSIMSLTWCPAPVNIFPVSNHNTVKNASRNESQAPEENESPKTTASVSNKLIWTNLTHADQENDENTTTQENDFLKDCASLKNKILGIESPERKKGAEEIGESSLNKTPLKFVRSPEVETGRALPQVFDPSADICDDLCTDSINEDKDSGTEKDLKESKDDSVVTNEEKVDESPKEVKIETTNVIKAEEEPRKEYLLASAGRDGCVYIWRAGTDGRLQTYFKIIKGGKKAVQRDLWINICWATPTTLLTTSMQSELLAWPLPRPVDNSKQSRVIHDEHNSRIFNIVAPLHLTTEFNWKDSGTLPIWTYGHDIRLVLTDLQTGDISLDYMLMSAGQVCFASSPLDPNRLAIGQKDHTITLWDLSLPNQDTLTMYRHRQKLTGRIMSIQWHPTLEMILGYGNDEGRVGFVDFGKKTTTVLSHYFNSNIYQVEWGPVKGDKNHLGLYVVSDGQLVIYDINKSNEPLKLELGESICIYRIAWKPDFSVLLLNMKDGSTFILSTDLVVISKIYIYGKGLNGIVWHPDCYGSEPSERSNWFAALTTKGLLVYDCTMTEEDLKGDNPVSKVIAEFVGHTKATIDLAWNPLDGNQVVSTGSDGLAHVWDVANKTMIATFVSVNQAVFKSPVIWSPIDPDLIVLGDQAIQIRSIAKNPPKTEAELAKLSAQAEKSAPIENKIKIEIPAHVKKCQINFVPNISINNENVDVHITNMRQLVLEKEHPNKETESRKVNPVDLFSSNEQLQQLLTNNYKSQKSNRQNKICEFTSLWTGNMAECVTQAITENTVNPMTISLAAMVSPKLWKEACEVYAKKLSEEPNSDGLETAMYFLFAHKVEEAVDVLCDKHMHREALALAKCRFPEDSSIIVKTTKSYSQYCLEVGNFELAAYCYISLGDYETAAKALMRRNTPNILEFAAELAHKIENTDLFNAIQIKLKGLNSETEALNQKEDIQLPSKVDAILNKMTELEIAEEEKEIDIKTSENDDIGESSKAGGDTEENIE